MSWFKRRKSETLTVDLPGLGRLIEDITGTWLSELASGIPIRVRPHLYNPGQFVVTISPDHADTMRKKLRAYETGDVYGPRNHDDN